MFDFPNIVQLGVIYEELWPIGTRLGRATNDKKKTWTRFLWAWTSISFLLGQVVVVSWKVFHMNTEKGDIGRCALLDGIDARSTVDDSSWDVKPVDMKGQTWGV